MIDEPVWRARPGRRSRPVEFNGPLAGTSTAVVEFNLDGAPLERTESWRSSAPLVAKAVARLLRLLRRNDEAIILAIHGAESIKRSMGQRTVKLRPEELIYFDFIRRDLVSTYRWLRGGDDDSVFSRMGVLAPDSQLERLIAIGWDWNTIGGYVVPKSKVDAAFGWATEPLKYWHAELSRELRSASIVFEDTHDGTALRIYSRRYSFSQLARKLRLDVV